MTVASTAFIIGLLLDIVGAWFLALSFVTKRLTDLKFEGTSGFGSPPNLRYIHSALYQKAEAKIGFAVLALGFGIQALDHFGVIPWRDVTVPKLAVTGAAAFIGLVAVRVCNRAKLWLFRDYGREMAQLVADASSGTDWLCRVAEYLLPDLPRLQGETNDAFATRVRGHLRSP